MARTVLSVALRQTPGKSGSTRGNVVASISSMEKAALEISSSKRIPPKRRARMAKKVETLPEKKTVKTSKGKTIGDQESKGKQKGGGGEGLKTKYVNMIAECILTLQQKNGSSRPVIANQLKLQFAKSIGYNEAEINLNIKLALKKGLEEGVFKMAKTAGKGSGSYKLTESEVKKLKKKKQKQQPAAAKTKQQGNMDSFISRTPKAGTNNAPEVTTVKTPDSYVLLHNVLSPQFNQAKDENQSDAPTPKSKSNKSSLKKKVKTPKAEDDTIVKTPKSTNKAMRKHSGAKEDERKLKSGNKGGRGQGTDLGRSSSKKVADREVTEKLVTFSSSSPSLRRNVKK